jgi:hypothetical protein
MTVTRKQVIKSAPIIKTTTTKKVVPVVIKTTTKKPVKNGIIIKTTKQPGHIITTKCVKSKDNIYAACPKGNNIIVYKKNIPVWSSESALTKKVKKVVSTPISKVTIKPIKKVITMKPISKVTTMKPVTTVKKLKKL